jgi:UDP-galactopyranose mutase
MPRAVHHLFARMLRHRRIASCDCDFREVAGLIRPRRATVYTGPIDEYFDHRLGGCRTVRSSTFALRRPFVQPCVQIAT